MKLKILTFGILLCLLCVSTVSAHSDISGYCVDKYNGDNVKIDDGDHVYKIHVNEDQYEFAQEGCVYYCDARHSVFGNSWRIEGI